MRLQCGNQSAVHKDARDHHLFADLLRQRLQQSGATYADGVQELHRRAGQWYEAHGLDLEAFHHAAAAKDLERAERLIEAEGVPLQFRQRSSVSNGTTEVEILLDALLPFAPRWQSFSTTPKPLPPSHAVRSNTLTRTTWRSAPAPPTRWAMRANWRAIALKPVGPIPT